MKFYSLISSEKIQFDVILKDQWDDEIFFTYFMYLGNTKEFYYRSYTKIQQVIADIGGFGKFFYVLIFYFRFYFSCLTKNKFILEIIDRKGGNDVIIHISRINKNLKYLRIMSQVEQLKL